MLICLCITKTKYCQFVVLGRWSDSAATPPGLPVLPLASSRASALSRPQDQDLAGPRYRRQAMCCSRPEPLWGNMQGTEQGAHFFAAVPKEHLFASLRVRCMFVSTDRSSEHKCISGWQRVYPRLRVTVKKEAPSKGNHSTTAFV